MSAKPTWAQFVMIECPGYFFVFRLVSVSADGETPEYELSMEGKR